MTNEQISELKAIGTAWGEQEVEAYRDQHGVCSLPAWTMGTYAGDVPDYGDDAELIIDRAARAAWETERAKPLYRVNFIGWGSEGTDHGTHLDGYDVADYGVDLGARYLSEAEALAAIAECTGPDVDGIEPMLEVVALP